MKKFHKFIIKNNDLILKFINHIMPIYKYKIIII